MRRNPFRARQLCPGRLPFFFPPGVGVTDLLETFLENSCRGQIVGRHGTGKSTLLKMLAEEFQRREYQVVTALLSPSHRKLPSLDEHPSPPCVLIVDGWEQASWWGRRKLLRHSRRHNWGLLVSTHHSVGLPTLWETSITLETARHIVDGLIRLDRLSSPAEAGLEDLRVPADLLSDLLARHQGDMREALFDLYDWFQSRQP